MTIGRPVEFDRDAVIDAAMEVFWRNGYEATSLQDLLAAMGLSKSSFYQAFGGKHQLFERCLERFRARQVVALRRALEAAPSGRQFIRDVLTSIAEEAGSAQARKGCLIMNTASEFAGRDPVIARLVGSGAERFANVFAAAVARAQREESVARTRNARVLARYLVATISGLRTMAKAGATSAALRQVADVALSALE